MNAIQSTVQKLRSPSISLSEQGGKSVSRIGRRKAQLKNQSECRSTNTGQEGQSKSAYNSTTSY